MTRRVLLIEDDTQAETPLRRTLHQSGIDFKQINPRNVQDLPAYLSRPESPPSCLGRQHQPTLIFLNLASGQADQLEILRQLKSDARTRRLPVILVGGSLSGEELKRCYALGANSFIPNPGSLAELQEDLHCTLSYWFDYAQLPPHG